jgi:hypothetical protein
VRVHWLGLILSGVSLAGVANGQAAPSQSGETTSLGATVPSASALATAPAPAYSKDAMRDEAQPIERSSNAPDPASLVPALPPLPRGKATLIGGTLEKLDPVRDQIVVRPFGGGRMKILFDARTHIYRDGKTARAAELKQGDRVYVDTLLDGTTIFARSIRFNTNTPGGESQGAVVAYRADKSELWVRDALSPEPLRVRLTSSTRLLQGERSVSASELAPGTLVAMKFDSGKDGHDVASEVSVLALPEASYSFAGQIVAVDLRTGVLMLTSVTDHQNYEIYFDRSAVSGEDQLRQDADVRVLARFDGTRYTAQNVTITSVNGSPSKP